MEARPNPLEALSDEDFAAMLETYIARLDARLAGMGDKPGVAISPGFAADLRWSLREAARRAWQASEAQ
jgi:hypothetical protein